MKLIYPIFISLLLFGSCKKNEPTTWNINAKGPVFKTTLSLNNILADSVLTENTDSTIDLNYTYKFIPINTDNVFEIPDTTISSFHNLNFPSPVNVNPGFQFVNNPEENKFDYGDARLTEMKLKEGKIKYKVTSQINEKTVYTYKILRSDDGAGNEFIKSITVPAGTISNPGVIQGEFDLSGYKFDMKGANGTDYNILETVVTVLIDPAGSAVQVSKFDSIFVDNSLAEVIPDYVKGYLGTTAFSESAGNTNFSIFNKITDGTIDINDVTISLDIKNYVGADARFTLSDFSSFNSRNSNTVSLSHNIINNPININRATINNGNIIPYTASYTMTPSNSNIDLFIENLPNELNYSFNALFNPLGNISGYNDFLYLDNTIDLDFNINLPLSLIANDLTLVDTLNLSIDSLIQVIDGKFELLAENSFPFDAEVQAYILNNQNIIVDSIFNNTLISAGVMNGANIVTQSTKTTLTSYASESKMNLVKQNPKMILKVVYNTQGSGHVNLYSYNKIDLKLIGDFNYKISLK